MEDLEGRDRRSNIRLIGLPDKVEGPDMSTYLEKWLKEEVVKDVQSPFFALERAQRVPMRQPWPGFPDRAVVAKLLHYRDRDTILQKAHNHEPYIIANCKVSIYPYNTFNVQKLRASFLAVKKVT